LIDLKKFLIIRMQDTNLICPELVKYKRRNLLVSNHRFDRGFIGLYTQVGGWVFYSS